MEYKRREAEYLLKLMAVAVNGGSFAVPSIAPDWDNIHELAVLHNVESLAYIGLSNAVPAVDDAVLNKYEESFKKAVVSEYIRHSEGVRLFKALDKAGISCVPLKGWIIKTLYPQPAMRSMCDIDVLVHPEQSQEVREIMTELGYDVCEFGGNPDTYIKKPIMNIEIHKALIQDKTDHFATTWNRVTLKPGTRCTYEMSHEDYYIFMMAHLRKHYTGTGTGIRSVTDVWVYLKQYENSLDWDYIREKLTSSGIWEFDRQIYKICRYWFGNTGDADEQDDMQRDLLFSAVYGTASTEKENVVASQLRAVKGGSMLSKKLRYILRLLFPTLEIMTQWYPWVKKVPVLLPLTWLMRGFVCVLFRGKRIISAIGDVAKAEKRRIDK